MVRLWTHRKDFLIGWMWNNREKDDTKIFGLSNRKEGITLTIEGSMFGVEGQ